ncbi:Leu/Phe/Val dehydrogenase [Porticoccus sp.]|uniref:Leu/Phe/Val dehydrogenase n=1 Tax=Porticoccus sp. TaxID=2024853 RepID=UPI003F6A4EC1
MSVFSHPAYDHHEKLIFHQDAASGLQAIVAIHNTNLGFALGGCRMWHYASEHDAVADVLRLSRSMTYKAAIAGLNLGGGKSVIIGDPRRDKTPGRMRAMGRLINSLQGEYVSAEDVGINERDISLMASETPFVTGYQAANRTESGGDPSPLTAYGVFRGIEEAVRFKLNRDSLAGVRVAIQGLGKVGYELARLLTGAGAVVLATDIFTENLSLAIKMLGVIPVPSEEIHRQSVDVFSPCAMGAVLNAGSIPELLAPIVAGSANNQLAKSADGRRLADAGILYVPDYVINAGGLIEVYYQYVGADRRDVRRHIDRLAGETLPKIFHLAQERNTPTSEVADQLARERFMIPSADYAETT